MNKKIKKISTRAKKWYIKGLKKTSELAASTDFMYDTQNDTILIVLFDHADYMLGYEEIYIRSSKSEKSFVKNGLTLKYEINTREFHEGDKYYLQLLYDGKGRAFRKFYIKNETLPMSCAYHNAVRIIIRDGKIIKPFDSWYFLDMLFWIIS